MTTSEFIGDILEGRKEVKEKGAVAIFDEDSINEVAGLLSGSFTYLLYEALWRNAYDMETITEHLEKLYDEDEHFGLIYFTFILANAVDIIVPAQFVAMSAKDDMAPILSAAIIEDWDEYDSTHEVTSESDE
jgi:hypothetical protein